MIDAINEALAGRYRVDSLAARGGMAEVYRATDLRHERTVAIKVMNPEYAASVGRERFLREIRVTAGLSHPHLLALYDSGEIGDLLFYVMPFVEGLSLRQRIQRENQLPIDDVVRILRESAEALAYAHARGIVHRDIKPENIMLAGYVAGDARARWNTLVADFGVSALTTLTHDHLTATGLAVGSPQYMSPEQAVGEHVDARTDVWALGCVAYEMIEGRAPRGVPTFTRRDVPAHVRAAIIRALSQDPAQRFDDPLQLADAMTSRSSFAGGGSRARLLIAATLVLAVIGGGAAAYSRRSRPAARGMTRDSTALALYNRGRASQGIRSNAVVAQAFEDFSGAIQRDSSFALAWAGLGRSIQMALLRGHSIRQLSRDSLLRLALFASQRAVNLDSTNAEVWLVRARVLESVDPTSRRSVLRDVGRALAIDSSNGEAWYALARAREELLDSAGARVAYERAVKLAPKNPDLLAFFALHGLWTNSFAEGLTWADSALAIDPTLGVAHEAAADLSIEIRDWARAERQTEVYRRLSTGADQASALGGAARLSALRGNRIDAKRFALAAERTVDSATLTKHQASYLGLAFSSIGDTARAVKWLTAFSPRADVHYQLHLHRDPGLVWVRGPKYRFLLAEPDTTP